MHVALINAFQIDQNKDLFFISLQINSSSNKFILFGITCNPQITSADNPEKIAAKQLQKRMPEILSEKNSTNPGKKC